jgi:hypothetical protein
MLAVKNVFHLPNRATEGFVRSIFAMRNMKESGLLKQIILEWWNFFCTGNCTLKFPQLDHNYVRWQLDNGFSTNKIA